jgi:hypothetical protein
LNLEAIDLLFISDERRDQQVKEEKQAAFYRAIQWDVVPKSRIMVNEAKARLELRDQERGDAEGAYTPDTEGQGPVEKEQVVKSESKDQQVEAI